MVNHAVSEVGREYLAPGRLPDDEPYRATGPVGTVVDVLPQAERLRLSVQLELHGVYGTPLAPAALVVGINDLMQLYAAHLAQSE